VTETILASNMNETFLKESESNYRLDEATRLSLQVPKFKYSSNLLSRKFSNELANTAPKIAGIVAEMPIQLAFKVIETSLEAAVYQAKHAMN